MKEIQSDWPPQWAYPAPQARRETAPPLQKEWESSICPACWQEAPVRTCAATWRDTATPRQNGHIGIRHWSWTNRVRFELNSGWHSDCYIWVSAWVVVCTWVCLRWRSPSSPAAEKRRPAGVWSHWDTAANSQSPRAPNESPPACTESEPTHTTGTHGCWKFN